MSKSRKLRPSRSWRIRVGFVDIVTYGCVLICVGSAAGVLPRIISIIGLIILIVLPIVLFAVQFWFQDVVDWFESLFFNLGRQLYCSIGNTRDAMGGIRTRQITKVEQK